MVDAGSGSTGSEWGIKPFPIGQDPSARYSTLTTDNPNHPGLHPSGPSTRSETSSGPASPNPLMLHSIDGHPQSPPLTTSSKTPRRESNTNVRQETDAGSVSVIPPSYDPTWAQAHGDPIPGPGLGPDGNSMLTDPTSNGQENQIEMPDSSAYVPRPEKR